MSVLTGSFLKHARAAPASPAVAIGNRVEATYAELSADMLLLADELDAMISGLPSGGVAICSSNPRVLIAGILAIRHTGRWYLPLDSAQPVRRNLHFISSSGCSAIITDDEKLAGEGSSGIPVLEVGRSAYSPREIRDSDLAVADCGREYVIFTSGSTGEPKGAMIASDAFTRLIDWFRQASGFTADDRMLVISSPGFDLTQQNYWTALVTGGCLLFPPTSDVFDPAVIRDTARVGGATVLQCAPSAFFAVAEDGSPWRTELRTLLLGGERIDTRRLDQWRDQADFAGPVVNTYGPTECTGIVAVSKGVEITALREVCSACLYIVDDDWRECQDGDIGELWIGGGPVGLGYVNNLAPTLRRFVPCLRFPGEISYRTGDRAVRNPDGSLSVLGRAEGSDVKLHGIRIDLEEIRDALLENGQIIEAFPFVAIERTGVSVLAAAILTGHENVDARTVRKSLRDRLPTSHIPSHTISLSEVPRSINGKADARAAIESAAKSAGIQAAGLDRKSTHRNREAKWHVVANGRRHALWPSAAETPEGWMPVREELAEPDAIEFIREVDGT